MKLAASNVDLREEGAGVTVVFVPGIVGVVVAEGMAVEGRGACVVALVTLAIVVGAVVTVAAVVVLEDGVVLLAGGVVVLEGGVVTLVTGAVVTEEHSSIAVQL